AVGHLLGPQGQNLAALDLLNVSDPANTGVFLTRFNLPTNPFSVALASGIAYVADGSSGLQIVNYKPFDNQAVPPTILFDTNALDVDPSTPGVQAVEGSIAPIKVTVSDDVQ